MKRIIMITGIWLLLAGGVLRAETARVVTLEECVDSAVSRNPAMLGALLEMEKAGILKGTAFNPPMTDITLKQETTGGGGPENGVAFTQEFEFPTVYVARHKALEARERLEQGRFLVLLSEIERDVTAAYYSLLYYRELLDLNSRLGEIYDEFCRVASVRLKEGESSRLELMNAERVKGDNEMEGRRLRNEYSTKIVELKRLTGMEGEIALDGRPFGLIPVESLPDTFLFSATPRGVVAGHRLAVAEREIAVARNEFLPGIKLGATVQALIKSFNPYHVERERFRQGNFMGFEVGITVPLFFGASKSRLQAAETDRHIALMNNEAEDAAVRAEVASLARNLDTLISQIEYYDTVALPRADEIKRLAQVSYELGEIDYIEYIANMETAFSLYREYAGYINDYNRNMITLKSLTLGL